MQRTREKSQAGEEEVPGCIIYRVCELHTTGGFMPHLFSWSELVMERAAKLV